MTDFLDNLLSPPSELLPGQIWRCARIQKDLIITNIEYENSGVIRGIFLSGIKNIGDPHDVVLQGNDLMRYISKPKVVLRATEGPIAKNDLYFYVCEVDAEVLNKITASIKMNLEYDELQEELIAEILEEIEPVRANAVNEYENWLKRFSVGLKLILVNQIFPTSNRFTYRFAAADDTASANEKEFWEKERLVKDKSLVVVSNESIIVRLSIVDGHLYFVAFSDDKNEIKNISLSKDGVNVSALEQSLNIKEKMKVFTSFDEKNLSSGEWELSYSLDQEPMTYKIEIIL